MKIVCIKNFNKKLIDGVLVKDDAVNFSQLNKLNVEN